MSDFRDKVAVVTGAASGIGLALAEKFLERGMKVVASDIDEGRLNAERDRLVASGGDVRTFVADTSSEEQVAALGRFTMENFGAAHVLCNNAGIAGLGDPWGGSMELWHRVVGINLFGVIHGIRTFLPLMTAQGEGHIVNTASMAGLVAMPGGAPYNATKHGVVALSEGLYLELKGGGSPVEVSVLCPGWVKTRLMDSDGRVRDDSPTTTLLSDYVRHAIENEGIAASAVAQQVVEAISSKQFWILTHPGIAKLPVQRMERAAGGENPSLLVI